MLTLYHFILTKEYVPLRQEGIRSLRDGKGGWSKGSRSRCAWAEEAPGGAGALQPPFPWEPCSLCPTGALEPLPLLLLLRELCPGRVLAGERR